MRLAVLTFLLLFAGCGSSLEIQKSMRANKYSLAYVHDSKPNPVKSRIGVFIDSIEIVKNIDDSLSVRNKGTFVLPLLFLNVWNFNYVCNMGKNTLEDDNVGFIKKNLIDEANRSGSFAISPDASGADYRLKIKISENKCNGPYNQSGFFYFFLFAYGYSFSEKAGPGTSSIHWTYCLEKGNSKIFSDSIFTEKNGSTIRPVAKDYAQLRKDFGNSMAEALSVAYKECIEKTISAINVKLQK